MSSSSSSSQKDDFDDFDFSRFEQNPSWLVDDIATMMDSKKYRYKTPASLSHSLTHKDAAAQKIARELRSLKSKLQPDKNETYVNLKKEKSSNPPSDVSELRLHKTKLAECASASASASASRLDESAIKDFLCIIQKQNEDKARRRVDFMKRSLYRPNPATLPSLPRRWSPTRPRPQVSSAVQCRVVHVVQYSIVHVV
jgi:hypothetical protein